MRRTRSTILALAASPLVGAEVTSASTLTDALAAAPAPTAGGVDRPALTGIEAVLGPFNFFSTVRVPAYLPQMVGIGRDDRGALAVSITTWSIFEFGGPG